MYDVIIVGAGVSGAASARELSRYRTRVCVLEKEEDLCCGTSKANSAIVHAGYDAAPGSLMAKLNVRGNALMGDLSKELDIPFQRIGSLVVCLSEEDMPGLQILYDRGQANGVPALRIIYHDELLQMEPNLSEEAYGALYAPTAGIVCPFSLNIALAENAAANGVEFHFDTEVQRLERQQGGGWSVYTNKGVYDTRLVVNAAGTYADDLHNMVSPRKIRITPRRGDYCLLDKTTGTHVNHTIFPLPGKYGKGVLVSPTIHGNLLLGPTAIDVEDPEAVNTTAAGLAQVLENAGRYVQNIPYKKVITSFAGLRAHEEGHEFIISEAPGAENFIDCAGIESPGLTSSPAIGEMVAEIVRVKLNLTEKEHFISRRKGIVNPAQLPDGERQEWIRQHPAYGHIVCRCEHISEGEILDAIHRPLGARSLDGVKRRVRAGMGRCQGGFCSPRVMELLSRELDIPMAQITKRGGASVLLCGQDKDSL